MSEQTPYEMKERILRLEGALISSQAENDRLREALTAIPPSFIAEFMAHRHFHAAADIDIVTRKDGKVYHIEGDWLKDFIRSLEPK